MYSRLVHYTILTLFVGFLFFLLPIKIWAQEYVLPYPAFMPGSPFYRVQEIIDKLQEFYSFGSLAKFKYHLGMADKRLVEAKTLFEYKQYLLASQAFPNYEYHLKSAYAFLVRAGKEGKNTSEKRVVLKSAINKHREVLQELINKLPESFFWNPEKAKPQRIEIRKIIDRALNIGRELDK